MSDTVTVTTRTSWFTRLKNSVIGALVGLLLVLGLMLLLFWNEGRAVQTARSLTEGAGVVVSLSSERVDPANEGQLVHVTGEVTSWHKPTDPGFGITAEGVRLERVVEMFQWKEETQSRTEDRLGGGQETVTTYRYSKAWESQPVDSSRFHQAAGHENPPMEISGQDFSVPEAEVGAFVLSPRIIAMIGGEQTFVVSPNQTAAIDGAYTGNKRVTVADGRIYLGFNSTSPAIGDYRISYRLAPLGPVSIIGRQSGNGFDSYQTQAGDELLLVETGTVAADEMFADAQTANTVATWIIRIAGLIFLWVGFALILAPISAVAAVIPTLGRLVGAGTGLVALIAAVLVGAGTIGIAWFWYRPLLAVAMIAAALVIAFALAKVGQSRARQTMSATPQAA